MSNPYTHNSDTFLASDSSLARVVARPVARFLHIEAAGGILLLVATVVALVWANSPWSESYHDFWETSAGFGWGDFAIVEPLRAWVNDGLMAIFFFVVGLEINRELTTGQLADRRAAALPAIAAVGGMVVPGLIYIALNYGRTGSEGWGIPMATDIAFALGVVALLGTRVPSSLKVFLLTLAIVDDLGAIAIIALFYTDSLSVGWALISVGIIGLIIVLRRVKVWYIPIYVILAFALWIAVFESGVHATLAGVVLGFLAPTRPLRSKADSERIGEILSKDGPLGVGDIDEATFAIRETVPVNERLEAFLHPWTSYVIIPIFALANAGIEISGRGLTNAFSSRVTLGIILGLVVGKTIGVGGAALMATKLGITRLPQGVRGIHMTGIALAAGIGFTVSLFISELAFGSSEHEVAFPGSETTEEVAEGEEGEGEDGERLVSGGETVFSVEEESKIGIMIGSLIAAIGASVVLGSAGNEQRVLDDTRVERLDEPT